MYCVLPIEVIQRDFEGRLLLCLELIKRGFDCILGKKEEVHQYMFQERQPFVYIAKGINGAIDPRIKKAGGILAILDEEGGVFTRSLSNVCLRLTDETIPFLDVYFSWGEEIRNELLEQKTSLDKNKNVVSGNPRFDLCRPEFNSYHQTISCGKETIKPDYILINTDFAFVNNQLGCEGRIKFDKKNAFLREYDKKVGGDYFNPERINREEEYQQTVFDGFVEMILALAERFKDKDIVIRPHPVENLNTYQQLFAEISNIHVIREGNAQNWINGALTVIHHDCTTGIEAMLMGKLTISFCPAYDPELVQWLPVEAGYKITDLGILLEVVQDCVDGQQGIGVYSEIYDFELIEKYIANVGLYSAGTIADFILKRTPVWEKRCQGHLEEESASISTVAQSSLLSMVVTMVKSLCHRQINRQADTDVEGLKRNKFPGISHDEISAKVSIFSDAIGLKSPVFIKAIGTDSYYLSSTS